MDKDSSTQNHEQAYDQDESSFDIETSDSLQSSSDTEIQNLDTPESEQEVPIDVLIQSILKEETSGEASETTDQDTQSTGFEEPELDDLIRDILTIDTAPADTTGSDIENDSSSELNADTTEDLELDQDDHQRRTDIDETNIEDLLKNILGEQYKPADITSKTSSSGIDSEVNQRISKVEELWSQLIDTWPVIYQKPDIKVKIEELWELLKQAEQQYGVKYSFTPDYSSANNNTSSSSFNSDTDEINRILGYDINAVDNESFEQDLDSIHQINEELIDESGHEVDEPYKTTSSNDELDTDDSETVNYLESISHLDSADTNIDTASSDEILSSTEQSFETDETSASIDKITDETTTEFDLLNSLSIETSPELESSYEELEPGQLEEITEDITDRETDLSHQEETDTSEQSFDSHAYDMQDNDHEQTVEYAADSETEESTGEDLASISTDTETSEELENTSISDNHQQLIQDILAGTHSSVTGATANQEELDESDDESDNESEATVEDIYDNTESPETESDETDITEAIQNDQEYLTATIPDDLPVPTSDELLALLGRQGTDSDDTYDSAGELSEASTEDFETIETDTASQPSVKRSTPLAEQTFDEKITFSSVPIPDYTTVLEKSRASFGNKKHNIRTQTKTKSSKKGITLAIAAALGAIAIGSWYFINTTDKSAPRFASKNIKQPAKNNNLIQNQQTPEQTNTTETNSPEIITADNKNTASQSTITDYSSIKSSQKSSAFNTDIDYTNKYNADTEVEPQSENNLDETALTKTVEAYQEDSNRNSYTEAELEALITAELESADSAPSEYIDANDSNSTGDITSPDPANENIEPHTTTIETADSIQDPLIDNKTSTTNDTWNENNPLDTTSIPIKDYVEPYQPPSDDLATTDTVASNSLNNTAYSDSPDNQVQSQTNDNQVTMDSNINSEINNDLAYIDTEKSTQNNIDNSLLTKETRIPTEKTTPPVVKKPEKNSSIKKKSPGKKKPVETSDSSKKIPTSSKQTTATSSVPEATDTIEFTNTTESEERLDTIRDEELEETVKDNDNNAVALSISDTTEASTRLNKIHDKELGETTQIKYSKDAVNNKSYKKGSISIKGKSTYWSLNLSSIYKTSEPAEEVIALLHEKDIPAELKQIIIGDSVWYRIRIRGFDSKQHAMDYMTIIRDKTSIKKYWISKVTPATNDK